jgi:hypothetical protein
MFGYTATLVLIVFLGWLSYCISFWPLGLFVAGAGQRNAHEAATAGTSPRCMHMLCWLQVHFVRMYIQLSVASSCLAVAGMCLGWDAAAAPTCTCNSSG